MCNVSGINFIVENCQKKDFDGRTILEVGSRYVNGGIRTIITKFSKPSCYIGVDIISGKGVDKILSAKNLVKAFGESKFDIVISTEMIEHVQDWKKAINEIKKVVKIGG